jgi:hypothetical protein
MPGLKTSYTEETVSMNAGDDNYNLLGSEESPSGQAYNFNPDPLWQQYVQTYEVIIAKIAMKYCSTDDSLRDDAMQEARVALATVRPEQIDGFESYQRGLITEDQWMTALRAYLRNAIRNSIFSMLDSYPKGNWYIGRKRHVKDRTTGATRMVYLPPRYSSLDELVDEYGMQVDENGSISWPEVSDDGLDNGGAYGRVRNNPNNTHWVPADISTVASEPDE